MDPFSTLVEQRIADAMIRGEFDSLPGSGKPLAPDDNQLVDPEYRLAYRILKNAGYVPAELECRREMADLGTLIATTDDPETRRAAARRLTALSLKLESQRHDARRLAIAQQYQQKLVERLHAPRTPTPASPKQNSARVTDWSADE